MKKISVVSFLLIVCFIASGCGRGPVRPERDCPVTELLLNESDFPSKAVLNDVLSPLSEYPTESAAIDGSYHGDSVYHRIARWYYYSVAIEENDTWMEIAFDPQDSYSGIYETPPELSNLNSLPASQIHVACADEKDLGYLCRMVARYEEYQILFFSDISERGITHEMFQDLVLRINDKMVSCLNKSK